MLEHWSWTWDPRWIVIGALALVLPLVTVGCDGCAGAAGGSCACDVDEECPPDRHCDGCHCVVDCASNEDCPEDLPNCNLDTGLCEGPCASGDDCPPELPNCDTATGTCFGLCASHQDCVSPEWPNCQLDVTLDASGLCQEPCEQASDCLSPLYPNCDPTPGQCLGLCEDDGDCPEEAPICDTTTGLCFAPPCVNDTGCDPPNTVCENWVCVPGCEQHADCGAENRCDLITPGHMYHCEPRDCLEDLDCNPPTTVCDTDGLADPLGGGYCLPGCTTYYDCPIGYDCDPIPGECSVKDYGDIGQDCGLGCSSQFCLSGMGNQCTAFCCAQHDCPPGWGCRPYDDGTGTNYMVDLCVPLPPTQGERRYGQVCTDDADCRCGECWGNTCSESCCTSADCSHIPGSACMPATERSVCRDPGTGLDPMGAPGCGTSGSPADCQSNLCYSFMSNDSSCITDADCTPSYPTCWDYWGDGITDCVRDQCVDHCCTTADCPDYGGDQFYCSKIRFGIADYNVCLRYLNPGTLAEGDACTAGSQCRSRFCGADGSCRARCCTDADCTDPAKPSCLLEQHWSAGNTRWVNVCMP